MADRLPFTPGFAGQRGRRSGLHSSPDCCCFCFCLLLLLACLPACLVRSVAHNFLCLNSFLLLLLYSALAYLAVTPLPPFSLSRPLSPSLLPTTTTTTTTHPSLLSRRVGLPSIIHVRGHTKPGPAQYPLPHTRRAFFLFPFPF
ncbi:hypothetical protein HOY80DRAFT_374570 [Tuber brumale]|nr:hypothetical protein HOY80DRAFT_374570 [Tuber brumale]